MLLVWFVMSLKSAHKEAMKKRLLCEDYIDITDIRYRHHCFFYDTFKLFFSMHAC